MPRYAAFLRGINVSGRRVTGDELCAALAEAGFEGGVSFRASGNIVFEADRGRPAELASRIEDGLGVRVDGLPGAGRSPTMSRSNATWWSPRRASSR